MTLRIARTSAFLAGWLPPHAAHHLPHWHGPERHLAWKDLSMPKEHAQEAEMAAPAFPKASLVARDPGLLPHSTGRAPGQPLLESCPGSTQLRYMKIKHQPVQSLPGTLLGGSYKSCQHGLPQAFSFSSALGMRHCLSLAPPPSEKAFCVPAVFIDIPASWPFPLRQSDAPSSPFKVAPVPTHCP